MQAIIETTSHFVQQRLKTAEGGHDWFHTERVWKLARLIAGQELDRQRQSPGEEMTCDPLVVELAALLHDVADSKFHDGDEELGPRLAGEFLLGLELSEAELPLAVIEHVQQIIRHMSFKGGHEVAPFSSLEMRIVQDADRLDAIGAIGIARAFSYGGFKQRSMYDPAIAPNLNMTRAQYKQSQAPTLNHFYEKLLLLKDRMHTEAARRLAEQRHEFMVKFLEQFLSEAHLQ